MNFEQIISDLKNKIYKPVYFLMGDEPYYIDKITNFIIKNVLKEEEQAFNQTILYGKDTDIVTVINTAKRYPMMANYQVVVVKEAQTLKEIDKLVHYVKNPLKSTILVINYKYKKLDKRKELAKVIDKNGILFESPKVSDYKIPDWIITHITKKGYEIDQKTANLLNEFLGNDLEKLENETEKLIALLQGQDKKVTSQMVEKYIGISKDYNNFELQKAFVNNDVVKANRIINYFSKNPKDHHINLTISILYNFFSKVMAFHSIKDKSRNNVASVLGINPYWVKEYQVASKRFPVNKTIAVISLLREYDMKSKGMGNVSTPQGELLREMVYKIMH